MHGVKIADLKNNLSRHIARVRLGTELTVLDRDTPVARIVPFAARPPAGDLATGAKRAAKAAARAQIEELQRLGIVGPGDPEGVAEWVKTHQPLKLPKSTPSAVDTLVRMRRESTR